MFTGLIQAVGQVTALEPRGGDVRLSIAAGNLDLSRLRVGDSVAVSGVCLTAIELDARHFVADVSQETLRCTTLGQWMVGTPVNLEPALTLATPLGGHFVSGHVDGVGRVLAVSPEARSQRWLFAAPAALLRYIAAKGSIAVDGVSLTVNEVDAQGFAVNLIPHTLAHTAFGSAQAGQAVNLEIDLIARYVERLMQRGP